MNCGILPNDIAGNGIGAVSDFFDHQQRQCISRLPWNCTGHKPQVSFAMAHTQNGIWLKYWVVEKYILARYKNINGPVYKDSCVEAFVAFNGDYSYYNLEFNCAGIPKGGYGNGKHNREEIPEQLLSTIETLSFIKPPDAAGKLHHWELTLFFPFSIFVHHHLTGLSGQVCRANFYKCGDELPEPHFLTWAPIEHPYPEFHLPQFFGKITFL